MNVFIHELVKIASDKIIRTKGREHAIKNEELQKEIDKLDLSKIVLDLIDRGIMDYDLAIKRDLPNSFEPIRDHGAHSKFCDAINDIRGNIRKKYASNDY